MNASIYIAEILQRKERHVLCIWFTRVLESLKGKGLEFLKIDMFQWTCLNIFFFHYILHVCSHSHSHDSDYKNTQCCKKLCDLCLKLSLCCVGSLNLKELVWKRWVLFVYSFQRKISLSTRHISRTYHSRSTTKAWSTNYSGSDALMGLELLCRHKSEGRNQLMVLQKTQEWQ